MSRDLRRQLDGEQTYNASGIRVFTIPTDSVLKEIVLQIRAQFSSGIAPVPSVPFIDAPFTLIKRIELVANGKDVIKSFPGLCLHQLNQLDFGSYQMMRDIEPAASANTGRLDFALTIPLASYGMVKPSATLLDTRNFSSLNLNVTFGAIADVFGTVGNGVVDNFAVTPWGHEILDLGRKSKFSVFQEVTTRITTGAASATENQNKLDVGNLYRALLISERDSNERALGGSTAGPIITTAKIRVGGSFIRRHWDARVLGAHQAIRRQLAVGMGLQSGPQIYETADATIPTATQSLRPGVLYLDFAEDGRFQSLLNARRINTLELLLDWSGANTDDLILVTSRRILAAGPIQAIPA